MTTEALPEALDRLVQREQAGERRLWAGRSSAWRAFVGGVGIWVFAVPWTAFALFWESIPVGVLLFAPRGVEDEVMKVAGMVVAALFGVPFVLAGFVMLAMPFIACDDARRTAWVVTDRRLLKVKAGRVAETTSWSGREIAEVRRRERPDGRGDLTVGFGWSRDSDGDRVEKTETLRGVPRVREVEALVRRLRPA